MELPPAAGCRRTSPERVGKAMACADILAP
jgi:hypothetical protein